MKKLIPLMTLLVGVSGALAQGTVNFRNNQTDFPTSGQDRKVYDLAGAPLVGTNWQARLVYGSDAASLQPATYITPTRFNNVTTGNTRAGTWIGDTRTLAGFNPGSTVLLQVQVWDAGPGATGRTYEEALAAGLLHGESAVFTYAIPTTGTLTTQAYYMDNLRSFTLVPEPSVIGLGLVGIGALFMLRRRKA